MRVGVATRQVEAIDALQRAVVGVGDLRLAWVAMDGAETLALCAGDPVDLLLLDLLLPAGGVDLIRRLLVDSPCAILLLTSPASAREQSARIFDGLGAGAFDAAPMPRCVDGHVLEAEPMLARIGTARRMLGRGGPPTPLPLGRVRPGVRPPASAGVPLVVMGASAGGPGALATILRALPGDFPGAIVIVQHIDARFAPGLVEWLAGQSSHPVRAAADGDRPRGGEVLVATGHDHLALQEGGTLRYVVAPAGTTHRPSIDVFFHSVATYWRGDVTGVLLTGMGRDGALGLRALREAGATTLAQAPEGCAVYGMPKAADEVGAVAEAVPLARIAARLGQLTARRAEVTGG